MDHSSTTIFSHETGTGQSIMNENQADGKSIDGSPPKRARQSIAHDLICPITKELPFDPVMAEDGRVYEREAILAHFQSCIGSLKSPVTNVPMGCTLHPSHQFKNIIETSVTNGDVPDDLARAWLQKRSEKETLDVWRKQALDGNGDAAAELALCYYFGTHGVEQSYQGSIPFWKIAAKSGNLLGMQVYGDHLTKWGTFNLIHPDASPDTDDHVYGTALLYEAASGGSACACLALGMAYAGKGYNPYLRLPQSSMFALKWLQKGLDANECVQLDIEPTQEYRNQCIAVVASLTLTGMQF